MAEKAGGLKQQVAETFELPKDIIMDVPKIVVIGNFQLNIENHRGIIQYDSDSIRINTNAGIYKITGRNLIVKNIVAEEITICGAIENINISD